MVKFQKERQRRLEAKTSIMLLMHLILCVIILCTFGKSEKIVFEPKQAKNIIEVKELYLPIITTENEEKTKVEYVFNDSKWNNNDDYLLAKIAMAEAEGCSLETKCLVIMTILNRVKDDAFPNTITEVIYQKRGNTYQFSPIGDGRWNKVEPNEECWLALEKVMATENDFSQGALYFESCANEDNWHSRNLNFLYKSDTMRFYK